MPAGHVLQGSRFILAGRPQAASRSPALVSRPQQTHRQHQQPRPCCSSWPQPGPRQRTAQAWSRPAQASSVELPPEEYVPPSGQIESLRLDGKVRRGVEDAVEALGRRVTVGDVASRAGVSLAQAEEALNALAADSAGSLEVSSQGEVLYTLPANFRAIISGRSWLLRSQPALRAVGNAGAYLVRVAFGAALLASVTLVWTAIFAVMSSSSSSSNNRERQRGGGGGTVIYMNNYFFQDILRLFWYSSPRYDRMQQRRGQQKQMGFLEAVFSFVFGDGDPNLDFEERRWKQVGELIARNGGVVTAEQLAPFLDPNSSAASSAGLDEDFVVPALVRFGGSPEVDSRGNLLYSFPSLQSSGAVKHRAGKLEAAALEKPWKMSRAQGGQKWGALALGLANLVGVLVLQGLLASRGVQYSQYAELATAMAGPLFYLKVYAFSFFLIPALRWLSVQAKNRTIDQRNERRASAARALAAPSAALQQKLDRARAQAKRKVIQQSDIIYDSKRGAGDKDWEAEDFDKRLEGGRSSSKDQLSDARLVWDRKQQQQERW